MNKLYRTLMACLLIGALQACKKGSNVSPVNASNLILGKWNLQKQKVVIYINGAIYLDTTGVTSVTHTSNAQFNKDNTFSSIAWDLGVDATSGTYSIVNSSLNTTATLAGLLNASGVGFYDQTNTAIQTTNVVSRISKITLLTSSQLNLHYELVYYNTLNNIFKQEEDYYYTR